MGKYIVKGNKKLNGTVVVNGSKNSALPLLSATLLTNGVNVLDNCPKISDTDTALDILKYIGCSVKREGKLCIIDSSSAEKTNIPTDLVKKMRSSVIFIGALLSRFKKVTISYPGGCELGKRPIDLHLSALKKMGVKIIEKDDLITCSCKKLKGCKINLAFPSVGATQNIILAGVMAENITTITNCAKEPEIVDLCDFLNKCGAKIEGAGSSTITIIGVKKLTPTPHKVIPDRIEAGTYLIAGAITKGNIKLENVMPSHLMPLLNILTNMGCKIKFAQNSILLKTPKKLINIPVVKTLPYPDFPTDLQPQLTALTTVCEGICHFEETIFENRIAHIDELKKLGANINLENNQKFSVKGVKKLYGNEVVAKDLRGGVSLILGGLVAYNTTVIENSIHIERGYENIVENLINLGANITLKN